MTGVHDAGSYMCPGCGNRLPDDCSICVRCGWERDGGECPVCGREYIEVDTSQDPESGNPRYEYCVKDDAASWHPYTVYVHYVGDPRSLLERLVDYVRGVLG